MKKLIASILILAALLSLTACGPAPRKKNIDDFTADDWQAAADKLADMDPDEIDAALEAAFGEDGAAAAEETEPEIEPIENYLVTVEITPENFEDYFEVVLLSDSDEWGDPTGYYSFALKSKVYDDGLLFYPKATDSDFLMQVEYTHRQTYTPNVTAYNLVDMLAGQYGYHVSGSGADHVDFQVLRTKGSITFLRAEYVEKEEYFGTYNLYGHTLNYHHIYLKDGSNYENNYIDDMRW